MTALRASPGSEAAGMLPESRRVPLFDDDTLSRLRRVILQSRRLAMSGLTGEHRSLRKGMSPEFSDYKPYTEGDDFRRVDWNAYARFDDLVVRESDTTTEFDVHILVDVSRSMDWASAEELPTKLRHGLQVAGALGYLSLWHFDRLTVTPLGSDAGRGFGPLQGRPNIVPMLRFLERIGTQREIPLAHAIGKYVHLRRRAGMLVVLSDFLSGEPSELEPVIHGAAVRGWQTLLLHILDPFETDPTAYFDPTSATEIRDPETGERLRVRGDQASIARYFEQRNAWLGELEILGSGTNVRLIPISTTQPVDDVILRLLRTHGLVTR